MPETENKDYASQVMDWLKLHKLAFADDFLMLISNEPIKPQTFDADTINAAIKCKDYTKLQQLLECSQEIFNIEYDCNFADHLARYAEKTVLSRYIVNAVIRDSDCDHAVSLLIRTNNINDIGQFLESLKSRTSAVFSLIIDAATDNLSVPVDGFNDLSDEEYILMLKVLAEKKVIGNYRENFESLYAENETRLFIFECFFNAGLNGNIEYFTVKAGCEFWVYDKRLTEYSKVGSVAHPWPNAGIAAKSAFAALFTCKDGKMFYSCECGSVRDIGKREKAINLLIKNPLFNKIDFKPENKGTVRIKTRTFLAENGLTATARQMFDFHNEMMHEIYKTLMCPSLDITVNNVFLDLLLQFKEKQINGFGKYLSRMGYQKVAVYSLGVSNNWRNTEDKILIKELVADETVLITELITNTHTTINDIKSVKPYDFQKSDRCQAIFVCNPNINDFVKAELRMPTVSSLDAAKAIYDAEIYDAAIIRTLFDLTLRGVRVLLFVLPSVEKIARPSEFESSLKQCKIDTLQKFWNNIDELWQLSGLADRYSKEAFLDALKNSSPTVFFKDYWHHSDAVSSFENVSNNCRIVTGCVKNPVHTIHCFGDSTLYGRGMYDSDTLPSMLQAICNDKNDGIAVVNRSMCGAHFWTIANRIADTEIKEGDTVIVFKRDTSEYLLEYAELNKIAFINTNDFFQRPHDLGEVFLDMHHLNFRGNKKAAEILYDKLLSLSDCCQNVNRISTNEYKYLFHNPKLKQISANEVISTINSVDFNLYINSLKSHICRKSGGGGIGAIVVNCNPFTLGHRYLIEYASTRVAHLYVFVVEEDRSIFPFNDRIKLVKQGTADLTNVTVLPSGKFIISAVTFPDYFLKDMKQNAVIDPTFDVELFGKEIAPILGITVRFAGEEPLDAVTRQYNETMLKVLPRFGIKFVEIPRKQEYGEVISASRVRKLLKQKDFNAIARIVPTSTLEYLKKL